MTSEPIDAVYLWVNGNDPEYQALLRECETRERVRLEPDSVGARRFRDHGELRYSLRSLETYAPWIRHVYIVTNGQIPGWLDTANPRVTVVPHAAIFANPRDLPTFNSNAISLHLHRIPNLSRWFLCLDDDYFLGEPVPVDAFLEPSGRQWVCLDAHTMPTDPDQGSVLYRACAYTQTLLDRRFGPRPARRAVSHVPQLVDREVAEELTALWPDEASRTSAHRFRSPTDVVPAVLYVYYLLEAPLQRRGRPPRLAPKVRRGGFLMRLTGSAEQARLDFHYIAVRRPRFFCINDDLLDDATADTVAMQCKAFLAWYFPRPSSFELSSR
jgi:hypothetical protein